MIVQTTNSTIQRFNAIRWHDSKLLGLCFYRAGGEERIRISLELLREDGALTPAEMILKECAYVEASVYLQAKSMCSDDISDAECRDSSDWKTNVSQPSPYDVIRGGRRLEQFLHFRIGMCVPGGTINILAKDFSLKENALK
jgi:hypothetical protein